RRTSTRCKASWTTSRPGSTQRSSRRSCSSRSPSLTTSRSPRAVTTTRMSGSPCPRAERSCSASGCASGGSTRWYAARQATAAQASPHGRGEAGDKAPGRTDAPGHGRTGHDEEPPTMRKAEIVHRIVQELGGTTAKADAALESVLGAVKAALQRGEPVILRG